MTAQRKLDPDWVTASILLGTGSSTLGYCDIDFPPPRDGHLGYQWQQIDQATTAQGKYESWQTEGSQLPKDVCPFMAPLTKERNWRKGNENLTGNAGRLATLSWSITTRSVKGA